MLSFDLELPGKENIYVYGAILGMRKKDIQKHYTEIVEFAEIGDFIYQPVRTYSSGMYSRLAFAVAAHLEPQILIVDEILSVGDAAFRQKCYRKMEALQAKCIILFVSHDMTAISSFCNKVIWIHSGEIVMRGKPKEIMQDYYEFMINKRKV